uniref:Ig-like domain-containing protein n=1 Tax=Cynoglossus semilaevis TaxID=244447 RepID=A0A3P8VGT8_CYNSE
MPGNIFLKAPYYGSRINIHQNGTLEIHNVRPTDTAEFTCLAKNDGGEASMVVQLEVNNMLRRPIFKNPYNERIVSRSGKTTILNCSAVGNPTPEIIWTLPNGTRFTAGPDRGSRHHLGNDGTLIIYNPQREDAGKYRCGAKNPVGYIEKLIILEVGQKPYILTRPKGVLRTMSGEPIALHCLAEGIPTPRIHWTIPGGHTLAQPQVLSRYHLLENGTLIIYETTLHDRGNYICRAQNSAGEAVLTVPLVVILPDRSLLSTAQQGRPTGSELLHPQGTLIIQRPTFADSGTYKYVIVTVEPGPGNSPVVHIWVFSQGMISLARLLWPHIQILLLNKHSGRQKSAADCSKVE